MARPPNKGPPKKERPISFFHNANVPEPMKLPKGKLVKIEFTEEMKEEIRRILNGDPTKAVRARYEKRGITDIKLMRYRPPGLQGRLEAVRKIVGGRCCQCDKYNSFLLKYKVGLATVVQRFCEDHIPEKI